MAAIIKFAPWLAIAVSLLAPTPLERARRLALAFVALVVASIILGIAQWVAVTRFPTEIVMAPIFVAVFGWIAALPAFALAVGAPTRSGLRLLALVGGLITFGALALSFLWFAIASWAGSAEDLERIQTPVQVPLLGCAALGFVLAVLALRAVASVER